MNPLFLGREQCFNFDTQCYAGEENIATLLKNPKLKQAFAEGCASSNPNNRVIRCCPLDLINVPYIPQEGQIPVHVKKDGAQFNICPESIRSECVRETDPVRFISCVAEKCNDAGYLEADNYYQVCKAYRRKAGKMETVPDCTNRKCTPMMKIPAWYLEELQRTQSTQPNTPPAPLQLTTPPQTFEPPKKPEETGLTLSNLFDRLPKQEEFYSWGSLILGIFAIVIIVSLIFVLPKIATTSTTVQSQFTQF